MITITITIPKEGNVSTHTRALDVTEAEIEPMLHRAQQSLAAEIAAFKVCPYHQRSK